MDRASMDVLLLVHFLKHSRMWSARDEAPTDKLQVLQRMFSEAAFGSLGMPLFIDIVPLRICQVGDQK